MATPRAAAAARARAAGARVGLFRQHVSCLSEMTIHSVVRDLVERIWGEIARNAGQYCGW